MSTSDRLTWDQRPTIAGVASIRQDGPGYRPDRGDEPGRGDAESAVEQLAARLATLEHKVDELLAREVAHGLLHARVKALEDSWSSIGRPR
jgi:hypothetical protein